MKIAVQLIGHFSPVCHVINTCTQTKYNFILPDEKYIFSENNQIRKSPHRYVHIHLKNVGLL